MVCCDRANKHFFIGYVETILLPRRPGGELRAGSRRSRLGRAAGVEWEARGVRVMCQEVVNDVWPFFVSVAKQDRWHGGR